MRTFVGFRRRGGGRKAEYMRIILASQSPRRRELLKGLIDEFEIVPALCGENAQGSPVRVTIQQGYDKALDVFLRNPDALVIGADSVVTIDGLILGKPADEADARRMLGLLSGRVHSVITGMCVVSPRGCVVRADETRVEFRSLAPAEIDAYIATKEPMDKAGAYGIQGLGGALVRGYEGDYDNVVGLCVSSLAQILTRDFGLALANRHAGR